MITPFKQSAPTLGNQYTADRMLRSLLRRKLPTAVLAAIEPDLLALGGLAGDELYQFQLADRLNEPRLTQWDAWGERVDAISLSPLWERAQRLAAEAGIVATAYDPAYGEHARLHQFALAYLFHPSTDVYTCPLAMTDGAARTLLRSGNQALIERAVPRLLSRDPALCWTSGQWMTESTGGSDVGRSETLARQDADGTWRLYGRKWFTSATTSEMALTLARPEGSPAGGRGLALFYVETRDERGRLRNIQVNRLKDKLGTRKVPTAELSLDGAPAIPVAGLSDGVSAIIPMLHLTRTWNSVMSASVMRRGMALAYDYAGQRVAFGRPLAAQPLHLDTLATLQAETEAAFHLSFFLVELIGADEAGTLDPAEHDLLRLLTSLAKLTTGRQAVDVVGEVIEAFGGAGYVEDTGLPTLLRDAHVLPIWEGTTNVLALDALRALSKGSAWTQLRAKVERCREPLREPSLVAAGQLAESALRHADRFISQHLADQELLQAGMRRVALTAGRATALALLLEHAQWSLDHEADGRAAAAARRFARTPIDLIVDDCALEDALLLSESVAEATSR
ncbi:MAG: acyl-CoA dehydrogenase family protein [Herpetosiphonaceae bacterium]|nr:acyl-CoA dehydrogenase family protein [Herpetosiphonaceae bacterium]